MEKYDLYKCYGLLKTAQEKRKEAEILIKSVGEEMNLNEDWQFEAGEITFNDTNITVEEVKKHCDDILKRMKKFS